MNFCTSQLNKAFKSNASKPAWISLSRGELVTEHAVFSQIQDESAKNALRIFTTWVEGFCATNHHSATSFVYVSVQTCQRLIRLDCLSNRNAARSILLRGPLRSTTTAGG